MSGYLEKTDIVREYAVALHAFGMVDLMTVMRMRWYIGVVMYEQQAREAKAK